ncbi:MAG: hypothetical protein KDK37_13055 [Leptospiraceae bacterium]|nr:hypothetical protein [Leptospiraceae bacterium]
MNLARPGYSLISQIFQPEFLDVVAVDPALVIRSGPGIQHSISEKLPVGHPVQIFDQSDSEDTILGETDHWCHIRYRMGQPATMRTGWAFCRFIQSSYAQMARWAILNGRAVLQDSEEYIESRGLSDCSPVTLESIRNFRSGCIDRPCYPCNGMRLLADGRVSFSATDVTARCFENIGGHWFHHKDRIFIVYPASLMPDVADACMSPEESKRFAQYTLSNNREKYGKTEFAVMIMEMIEMRDGKPMHIVRGVDWTRKKGKQDRGQIYDRTNEPRCFYPYSKILEQLPKTEEIPGIPDLPLPSWRNPKSWARE